MVACGAVLFLALLSSASSAAVTPTQALATPTAAANLPEAPLPIAAPARDDAFRAFRAAHPEANWPHWFADDRIAWSTVGLDGGAAEGLVATDGTVSPVGNILGVSLWLRDDQRGQLYVPRLEEVSQSLAGGHLPLITTRWSLPGATLTTVVFAGGSGPDPITAAPGVRQDMLVQASVAGSGPPRPWTLYVALRPFGPAGGLSPLHSVATTRDSISTGDTLALVAQRPADRFGALNEISVDASVLAKAGRTPAASAAASERGLAEGLLAYDLQVGGQAQTFGFALPMQPTPPTPAAVARLAHVDITATRDRVAVAWQRQLERVQLSLPDPAIANAFYASLAYILMARHGDELYSGPLSEHAFWFRDAAYITAALDRAGFADTVRPILRFIASTQLPSGRYPPIVLPDGQAQLPLKTEWDTQGEVIFALVDYARQNRDLAFLHSVYPGIWRAARFQAAQLQATRTPALRGTPYYGILPAGESAEDLYNADWHHYWDDFWALTGFSEAVAAATALGFDQDVPWLSQDEADLRAAVLASVESVRVSPDGRAVIPNGPEDRKTTAMARSGTPSVWPLEVLDPTSDLVRYSFDTYWTWAIKPNGGAYQHYNDHYWPYADVSLAHAFYRLGMLDHTATILQWVFAHQTAPNLYAWAEVVRPETSTFALGDMPHSWMAAEMVLLIRDMLVREESDSIAIGPVLDTWLPPGGTIAIRDFPTALGPQGYTLRRSADGATLTLSLAGIPPPGGYTLHVPPGLGARTYSVDGGPAQTATGDAIPIPGRARTATVTVSAR